MKKAERITAFITSLVVVLAASYYLGHRMMPERTDFGATWGQYLAEPKDSLDLLFIGSSIAYCDIEPSIIYEETGLNSYMVCGPELNASLSYYYLKEALNTQSPKAVFVEASSFFFKRYTSYTKVNVGYMPVTRTKLEAIFKASEEEERAGLLFPLYNYHSRWSDLSIKYVGARSDRGIDPAKGYTYVDEIVPQEGRSERNYYLSDDQLNENLQWLGKIKELCAEEGIELVLFVAPQCEYPSDELMASLAAAAGDTKIINYNDDFDSLGLDISHDYHDSLHLNCYGADKFSVTVAETIKSIM